MSAAKKSSSSEPEVAFEDAMERLDEIVAEMEGERLALDDMVSSYEEGMKLLGLCRSRIENARRRIERIQADGEEVTVSEFDPEAEPATEATRNPTRKRAKTSAEKSSDDDEIRLL